MSEIEAVKDLPLVRLSLCANRRLLPGVCALVRETARQSSLSPAQSLQIEAMTEELCLIVIEHAFQGRSNDSFDFELLWRNGTIVVAVEDKGTPFDMDDASASGLTEMGMRMLQGLSDAIKVEHLGKRGIRIELTRRLEAVPLSDSLLEDMQEAVEESNALPPKSELATVIREMTPDDAKEFARCIFNVYGYSYKEIVYFPEKVRDKLLNGLLFSYVAVAEDGHVVAHQGLVRSSPVAPIAEIAMGVVDPRFRGRGLFEKLKREAFDAIIQRGVYGLYGEAITNHPFSQKTNFAMGGRETGFLLNRVGAERLYKAMDVAEGRRTICWFYNRLAPEPARVVHAPAHHAAMIGRIYEHTGLNRSFAPAVREPLDLPALSRVDVNATSDTGTACLQLVTPGRDLLARLANEVERLRHNNFAVVFLDMPLSHPATAQFCAQIEDELGFCFCAVTPETQDGDSLRLQYLNSPAPSLDTVVTVTSFGRELLLYVLNELNRVRPAALQAVA